MSPKLNTPCEDCEGAGTNAGCSSATACGCECPSCTGCRACPECNGCGVYDHYCDGNCHAELSCCDDRMGSVR